MKTDTLYQPDSAIALQEIYSESPGYIYFYVSSSIRSELEYMRLLREDPEITGNESLLRLIDQHIEGTEEQKNIFDKQGQEVMIAIKKPPSPAPPPQHICYFTTDPKGPIVIEFNGRLVMIQKSYDQLTHILSVKITDELTFTGEDRLNISFGVSFTNEAGIQETQLVEWEMRF